MIYNLKHTTAQTFVYLTAVHLFSGALISTWVVLSHMAHCHFALTRSDNASFLFFHQHFLIVYYYFQQTDSKGGRDNISLHMHKAHR